MSDSVWPHRRQPTKLPRPWDSPGKNTGVGCHFLLQCMKVKRESEVVQSCPTLSDPMDCSPLGSSVHGIYICYIYIYTSQVAQVIKKKKKPTCQCRKPKRPGFDPWVGKVPLEKGMATHPNMLPWRIPGTEENWWATSIGSQRVGHDWRDLACMHA